MVTPYVAQVSNVPWLSIHSMKVIATAPKAKRLPLLRHTYVWGSNIKMDPKYMRCEWINLAQARIQCYTCKHSFETSSTIKGRVY
jgi:hypothetical protein